jgi:hypothetical protein
MMLSWPRLAVTVVISGMASFSLLTVPTNNTTTASSFQNYYNMDTLLAMIADRGDSNDEPPCVAGDLSDQCIDYEASQLARAFPSRIDRRTWCFPPNTIPVRKNSILRQGIILTKVPKAASSTSAGVALRITNRNQCHPAQWEHRPGMYYSNRHVDKSFLFTTIRATADRSVSSVFYHKFSSRRGTKPKEEQLLKELQGRGKMNDHYGTISPGQGGFVLQYTSMQPIEEYSAWDPRNPEVVKDPEQVLNNVEAVIDSYDMLLVVDRMDESLTALSLVLGVDVGDVVVADSKITGETYRLWNNRPVETSHCLPTAKSFRTAATDKFLQSKQWRASNYGDFILHAAASKSLDLTIEMLGKERFDATLEEYRRLKALVNDQCADQVHLPCGPDGQLQLEKNTESCYIPGKDFGCAYSCVDRLLDSMDKREQRYYEHIPVDDDGSSLYETEKFSKQKTKKKNLWFNGLF